MEDLYMMALQAIKLSVVFCMLGSLVACIPIPYERTDTLAFVGPGNGNLVHEQSWSMVLFVPIPMESGGPKWSRLTYHRDGHTSVLLPQEDGMRQFTDIGVDEHGQLWVTTDRSEAKAGAGLQWLRIKIMHDGAVPNTVTRLRHDDGRLLIERAGHKAYVSSFLPSAAIKPVISPWGWMDHDMPTRREWAPDEEGRFTRWSDGGAKDMPCHHPPFSFDRIDRRLNGRDGPELTGYNLLYWYEGRIVGVYWSAWFTFDETKTSHRLDAEHIFGWVENGTLRRLKYEANGTTVELNSLNLGLNDSKLRGIDDRPAGSWLDVDVHDGAVLRAVK